MLSPPSYYQVYLHSRRYRSTTSRQPPYHLPHRSHRTKRVWHGISMSPMRKMVSRLAWSGTYVLSAMQRNLIRRKRGWQGWSCITIGTLPFSGTMLLLLTKGFFTLCFLHGWVTKDCGCLWCLLPWRRCVNPSITSDNAKWGVFLHLCNGFLKRKFFRNWRK